MNLFKNAGLLCWKGGDLSLFLSYKRNGVNRIFYKNKLIYSDCGYIIEFMNGKKCATQGIDENAKIDHKFDKSYLEISITGKAGKMDDSLPLTRWIIPFKLFCKTVLRFNKIGYWFNSKLKTDKIERQYETPLIIKRKIIINQNELIIEDHLESTKPSMKIKKAKLVRDVTTVHSPSSRYYQTQYLLPHHSPVNFQETSSKCQYRYRIDMNESISNL
jgi:uncharacterized protein YkvS